MVVVVPDDQLSLAIGRKGQNVRLAARLTGWRIDVCSEAEAEEETRKARQSIGAIPGINDIVAELLYQEGFKSAEEIAASELEDILDVEGVSKEKAEALHKSAKEYVVEKQRKEAEEAAAEKQRKEAEEAAAAQVAAEAAQQTAAAVDAAPGAVQGDVAVDAVQDKAVSET
jgi:N utilization substance protein A